MNMQSFTADRGLRPPAAASTQTALATHPLWGPAQARIAEGAFVLFLLLVFVGLTPFAMPDTTAGTNPASGAGDVVRQFSYLTVFGIIAAMAAMRRGWQMVPAGFFPFLVLLGWCVLSAFWSIEPGVTLRRAVLVAVVSISAMLAVDTVGAARSLQLLRYVLAAAVIICWVSLPLIPQARHFANDVEQAVAGDWRGLYAHKNIAGGVCANAAIVFFYFAIRNRNVVNGVLFLAALGFLIGTHAKSSLGLLPLALLAGLAYRFAARNTRQRQIVFVTSVLAVFVAAAALWMSWDTIAQWMDDPRLFTGRMAIWQAELAFIGDHPLLGAGYGSFADTGTTSPIQQYVTANWIGTVATGHSGYLELLVTLGLPGFCLAMLCLVAQPVSWLGARSTLDRGQKGLLFTLLVFTFLHNFTETTFLETDGAEWVTFLLTMAMLQAGRTCP